MNDLALTQLRHVIAERLRSSILANEIKPGEWLRQEQLAQKFGVSQTPVREALQDLVGEGLVERVPYRGIRVIEFTLPDLLDLYKVRAYMEGLAARYAAKNISPEELAELEGVFSQLEKTPIDKNVDEHRKLHRHFHQLIYSASKHSYLIHSLDQMWATFPTMMLSNFVATADAPVGRGAAATKEHRAIVAALRKHDSPAAEKCMSEHIQATAKSISTRLKKQNEEVS